MQMTTELADILRKLHNRIGEVELDSFSKQVMQVALTIIPQKLIFFLLN